MKINNNTLLLIGGLVVLYVILRKQKPKRPLGGVEINDLKPEDCPQGTTYQSDVMPCLIPPCAEWNKRCTANEIIAQQEEERKQREEARRNKLALCRQQFAHLPPGAEKSNKIGNCINEGTLVVVN